MLTLDAIHSWVSLKLFFPNFINALPSSISATMPNLPKAFYDGAYVNRYEVASKERADSKDAVGSEIAVSKENKKI